DLHKEMRSQGLSSRTRLLHVEVMNATPLLVEKMGVRKGTRLLYLERVLEGEEEPLVFDRKYLLSDKSQPLLEAELGHGSIVELFAGNEAMVPVRNELTLSVTSLDAKDAEVLRAKRGAPAFSLEQLMIAANDVRVGWGRMLYRGDKFQFKSLSRML
ncbi:MAG: GntR family transcriptional regulator, partial [Candidatus Geothermincolia bacterium]